MSKSLKSQVAAGMMPMVVALFALIASVGADASVSGPDQGAVKNRSLMMCAALYGPRRDLLEDRCESLSEVPSGSPGRLDESVTDETPGGWPARPNITISQTNVAKEVLE